MDDLLEALVGQSAVMEELPRGLIVVAISGGVDSMVLLHLAKRLTDRVGGGCYGVHVNHGLRDASDSEETFVREQCQAWGIPVEVVHLKLRERFGETLSNIEDHARRERYQALCELALRRQAAAVWVGHHADDQLETMLWRLMRGASSSGFASIRPDVARHGVRFIRPLLGCSKRTIDLYAEEQGIPHIQDESNSDTSFTRNYLRSEVIPLLRSRQPRIAEHAVQLARLMQDEDEWMDQEARLLMPRVVSRKRGGFLLRLPTFLATPIPLQRRLIKILLYCLGQADWTIRHIESVLSIAMGSSPSACARLPASIAVERRYDALWIGVSGKLNREWEPNVWNPFEQSVLDGMEDGEASWSFEAHRYTGAVEPTLASSKWVAYLCGDDPLTVRRPRIGERVHPYGMMGSKKVSDVFSDAKVPRAVRWRWPVLADDTGIVWIPGVLHTRQRLFRHSASSGWMVTAFRQTAEEYIDCNELNID